MSCEKEAPLPGEGFITPTATTEWKEEELQDIKWEPQGWSEVSIVLYGSQGSFIANISNQTADDGIFEKWQILDHVVGRADNYVTCYVRIRKFEGWSSWGQTLEFFSENFIIYGE